MDISKYSPEEFNYEKEKIIDDYKTILKSSEKPKAYILGGQSGAGKSFLANKIKEELNDNVVVINGDEYRKLHPRFKELENVYGKDSVLHTQEFSGKMTEALINELSNSKYNLIIEGTLRTSEVPLKTANLLKDKQYQVELNVIAVKPIISYLSTINRYYKNLVEGNIARATPKEHHDLIVENIGKNLEVIKRAGVFDNIKIYNRPMEALYENKNDINPKDVIEEFFEEDYDFDEINTINKIIDYIKKSLFKLYGENEINKIIQQLENGIGSYDNKVPRKKVEDISQELSEKIKESKEKYQTNKEKNNKEKKER